MRVSKHKLSKQLDRELKHRVWLRKNIPKSKEAKENQKRILKLQTEIKLHFQ